MISWTDTLVAGQTRQLKTNYFTIYSLQLFWRGALYTARVCVVIILMHYQNTDFLKLDEWIMMSWNYFVDLDIRWRSEPSKTGLSDSLTASLMTNQYILTWLRPQQADTERREGATEKTGRRQCNTMASLKGKDTYITWPRRLPVILLNLFKSPYLSYLFFITLQVGGDCRGWSLQIFITDAPKTWCDSLLNTQPYFPGAKCSHNTSG